MPPKNVSDGLSANAYSAAAACEVANLPRNQRCRFGHAYSACEQPFRRAEGGDLGSDAENLSCPSRQRIMGGIVPVLLLFGRYVVGEGVAEVGAMGGLRQG
jgi:hypothetical protein